MQHFEIIWNYNEDETVSQWSFLKEIPIAGKKTFLYWAGPLISSNNYGDKWALESKQASRHYDPPSTTSTKLKAGYTGFTLSIFVSYLRILSSNFRRCVACKVCFKIKNFKFWQILWICNFDFAFFWLGIQYDSIVWVIMRQWRVSSECRRSSFYQGSNSCAPCARTRDGGRKLIGVAEMVPLNPFH